MPVIAMDYGYMESRADCIEQGLTPLPILVTRCSLAKAATADVLPCKGHGHPFCEEALLRAFSAAGHSQFIAKSDDEPSIIDLKKRAAASARVKHGMTIHPEESPHGDSQSNGLAEGAVR